MREPTRRSCRRRRRWNDKTLTIANRTLRDVLPQLKRWYGIDIKVVDLPLLDGPCRYRPRSTRRRRRSTGVEKSANVKFGYEGKTMVFHDAAAPAKKK